MRGVAVVIVGAAPPFATTSYARARLIRQMHASGLLSNVRRRPELAHDAPRPGKLPGSSGRPC